MLSYPLTVTYYIFSADLEKKKKGNLQYLKSLARVYDHVSRNVYYIYIYIPGTLFVHIFQRES